MKWWIILLRQKGADPQGFPGKPLKKPLLLDQSPQDLCDCYLSNEPNIFLVLIWGLRFLQESKVNYRFLSGIQCFQKDRQLRVCGKFQGNGYEGYSIQINARGSDMKDGYLKKYLKHVHLGYA